jgi:hypothetical protein
MIPIFSGIADPLTGEEDGDDSIQSKKNTKTKMG